VRKCDHSAVEEYARQHPEAKQHEIAPLFGIKQSQVSTILRRAGLTIPLRGGHDVTKAVIASRANARIRRQRIAEILRENPNLSYRKIAQRAGCCEPTVLRVAKEFGLRHALRRMPSVMRRYKMSAPAEPIPKATRDEIAHWDAILRAEDLSISRGSHVRYGRELNINGDVAQYSPPW
jgi:hypothetical protein